jgi:uncharacterized protein involved in oxidation of intracellular sulfur
MATFLFVLNDAPYGSEHSFNGLRLADSLSRLVGNEVRVFLLGDAAACAKRGQKVPHGFYNVELMLHPILRQQGKIGVCASCMDARGITDAELAEGCHRSSMEELTEWTLWAEKVLVF